MQGIVSEDILLVGIVKHTGWSAIVSSRICPRVFLHLGLKFPSDREDFLVGMCILLRYTVCFKLGFWFPPSFDKSI